MSLEHGSKHAKAKHQTGHRKTEVEKRSVNRRREKIYGIYSLWASGFDGSSALKTCHGPQQNQGV